MSFCMKVSNIWISDLSFTADLCAVKENNMQLTVIDCNKKQQSDVCDLEGPVRVTLHSFLGIATTYTNIHITSQDWR